MMGCATCVRGALKKAPGCKSKGVSCYGCEKKSTYDWLADMTQESETLADLVEVKFKNGRKDFFKNPKGLRLKKGDLVVTTEEQHAKHQIGCVELHGLLATMQYKKKKAESTKEYSIVQRVANEYDLEMFRVSKEKEKEALFLAKQHAKALGLAMHVTDAECYADMHRVVFYYTAEKRVDFRMLVKLLVKDLNIKVACKQIGARQETALLGGIGSCGRPLCCSTWLTDLKHIPTTAATKQNLSLNTAKLAGQCGKLKCCLNYELDNYVESMKSMPKVRNNLQTQKGELVLQKTDIFQHVMWFSYQHEIKWHPVNTKRVEAIIAMNKEGMHPFSLFEDEEHATNDKGQSTRLDVLDEKYSKKNS